MEVHEILSRAADVIDERGHCKYVREDGQNRVCIYGAFAVVLTGDTELWSKRELVAGNAMNAFLDWEAVDWNNAPERTVAEVTSALRACAAIERAKLAAPVNHPHQEPEYAH